MEIPLNDEDVPVARLLFHCTKRPEHTPTCAVFPNGEFDIGRREVQAAWNISEPTVSTHHLRFRCVVYEDEGDEKQVAPMVYARVLSSNQVRLTRTGVDRPDEGYMISKLDPDTLLNHGDTLYLTQEVFLVFHAEKHCAAKAEEDDNIRIAEFARFSDQCNVTDRRLGIGGNASVFVAVKQRTKRQVACKIVPLPFFQSEEMKRLDSDIWMTQQQTSAALQLIEVKLLRKREDLTREYNILKDINHPNIISLEKVICCTYNIYIFQELITGGDLLSYIDQKGALSEAQSAVIVRQILKAVEFLHINGIVHRDIKPENILMTSWRDGARVVLTDFGQARTIRDAKAAANSSAVSRMRTLVGTYGYTAPEVIKLVKRDLLQRGYSKAIDIWAIGCITAVLLTNDQMFSAEADEKDFNDPDKAQFSPKRWDISIMDTGEAWIDIGRKAKSFIRGCLVLDEGQRLTSKQALLHPWFTNKHYAADIEAAYQRAIQDWTPRDRTSNLIQFIDTTDAVPAAARPEHVERLAEQVKSRHFQTVMPTALNFSKSGTGLPQQKRKCTPLPAGSGEAEQNTIEVPASPGLPEREYLFASPNRVAELQTNNSVRYPPLEDSLMPCAKPMIDPRLMCGPMGTNDSVTQSQSMLDDASPLKLSPTRDEGMQPRKKVHR